MDVRIDLCEIRLEQLAKVLGDYAFKHRKAYMERTTQLDIVDSIEAIGEGDYVPVETRRKIKIITLYFGTSFEREM